MARAELPTREAIGMQDAAALLDVSYRTIRRLVSRRELTGFRVGRQVRITRHDLNEYRRTHSVK